MKELICRIKESIKTQESFSDLKIEEKLKVYDMVVLYAKRNNLTASLDGGKTSCSIGWYDKKCQVSISFFTEGFFSAISCIPEEGTKDFRPYVSSIQFENENDVYSGTPEDIDRLIKETEWEVREKIIMLKLQNTKGFKIVAGVTPGYFHSNSVNTNVEKIAELWKIIALQVQDKTGMYISSVITSSKTVYNTECGCPNGGKDTFTITGEANPEFTPNLDKWIEAVGMCATELKHHLQQTTLTIEFTDIQLVYLKEED